MRSGHLTAHWHRSLEATRALRVTLLGPFNIKLGERSAGPWYRPPAKRLCELVMASPGLRVGREVARELLFADLGPASSAKALSRALSLAREALSALGEEVAGRLRADRAHVWFSAEAPLEVDLVAHEGALRSRWPCNREIFAMPHSAWPWPKTASCSKTNPMPTGHCGPERPSNWSAREPAWSWPGTVPGAGGAQYPRRLSTHGSLAWRTTPRLKRRPLH